MCVVNRSSFVLFFKYFQLQIQKCKSETYVQITKLLRTLTSNTDDIKYLLYLLCR